MTFHVRPPARTNESLVGSYLACLFEMTLASKYYRMQKRTHTPNGLRRKWHCKCALQTSSHLAHQDLILTLISIPHTPSYFFLVSVDVLPNPSEDSESE